MSEYNYNPDYDIFDPRRRPEGSSSGRMQGDEEYRPRHPRKGLSSSGEYRPRHSSKTESTSKSSPSPAKEGGDDDFDVFNFDLARKRRQQREEELNARLAQAEAPREYARRIADEQRRHASEVRRRQPVNHSGNTDSATKRAANFARKLSGYSQPIEPRTSSGRGASTGSSSAKKSTVKKSGASSKGSAKSKKRSNGGIVNKYRALPTAKKAAVVVGCVLLLLIFVYYSAFGIVLSGMNSLELDSRRDNPATQVTGVELKSSSGVTNILLLGIDDDGGSGSRSDTMMIASLDSRSGTIRLCSILRDCYVEIPGHGSNRINAAYAYGGAQLAVETVESNFRVKIDHCVTIDMAALVDVVDAIGGVEIELSAAEANQVNLHSHCGLTTEAGLQLLNGKQAVTYAQIRKIDSDFMRTQRQRTLINAIINRIRSLGVSELLGVVEAVAPNVATDMSSGRIASLAFKALPALSNELGQLTIPTDGKYSNATINGMSVLKLDMEENAKLLQSYLYGD